MLSLNDNSTHPSYPIYAVYEQGVVVLLVPILRHSSLSDDVLSEHIDAVVLSHNTHSSLYG